MTAPRPTREQLLNLADRAERGQLTPAEAARLRQGITAVYASHRSTVARAGGATREHRATAARLTAVRHLTDAARRRGARSITINDLETAMRAATCPPDAMKARQGRPLAPAA